MLSNLRLVVKIAMEYRRAWTNTLDLIQEGNLGLLQAVQRFDPYAGTKLASYAAYWIRAYILKYLMDNIRLVKLGNTRAERKLFFRLNREKRELERQGFRPEPRLIAERLDVAEADVVSMEQRLVGRRGVARRAGRRRGRQRELRRLRGGADRVGRDRWSPTRTCARPSSRTCAASRRSSRRASSASSRRASWPTSRSRSSSSATRWASRASACGSSRSSSWTSLREYLKKNVVDFEYYAPSEE